MKTCITIAVKNEMGLKIVNGQITDKYGRTFETFINKKGYEDIRPVGVQRNMSAYYSSKNA